MAPSSSRNGAAVRLIAIHTAEGSRTKESLGTYFNSGVQASSHVGIDAGGVQQYVDYGQAAWTLRSGNPVSDNAELCAFSRWTRDQWLGSATVDGCVNPRRILENAAAWTRQRCQARGIPMVKLSPADVKAGKRGVIGHVDWTLGMGDGTHTDPGSNFPWDVFMQMVNNGTPIEEDDVSWTENLTFTAPDGKVTSIQARDWVMWTNWAAWLAANGVATTNAKLDAIAGSLNDNQAALLAAIGDEPTQIDLTDAQVQLLLKGLSDQTKEAVKAALREGTNG